MVPSPSGSTTRGHSAGDEPVRGGWGIWKAAAFLVAFTIGILGIFSMAGAPVPDLGLDGILNSMGLVLVGILLLAVVGFALWLARALVSPETDLL